MKMLFSFILFLLLPLGSFSVIAETPDFIKDCMDCHGNNGVSEESDIPTIAGASPAFLEASMFAYKDEARPAVESKYRKGDTSRPVTDMKKISDKLSDEQIAELSEFFASEVFVSAKQNFDSALAKKGKKVHERKCKKCHEDGGSSPDDDSGILAGQHTEYLRNAMENFLNGSREPEKKMKKKIDKMSDKEWEALLAFYASQQH